MHNCFLFTYGTLMTAFNNPMAVFLRKNSKFIGKCYFKGLLFDLGHYPGAIYDPYQKSKVHGELYQIDNSNKVFKVLDEYEGIGDFHFDLYKREITPININNEVINAEAYIYNKPSNSLKVIETGDYTMYLNS